jgi:hemerythrin-like metal-binding protein
MPHHPSNPDGPTGSRDPIAASSAGRPRPIDFLVWRDEWTLDVAFMDDDHRFLASRLNRIAPDLRRCASGSASEIVANRLNRKLHVLGEHTREHFRREEYAMRETDYPGLVEHKSEHDLLLAEYTILMRDIQDAGLSGGMNMGVLDALKEWLIAHVLDDDRSLADYLHGQGRADIVPPPRFVVDPAWVFSGWTEPTQLLQGIGGRRGPRGGR